MSKTYAELIGELSPQEIDEIYEYAVQLTEKNMSKDEVEELIDDAISAATKVKNDTKKNDRHKRTASSVLSKVSAIKKTFEKDGSIQPNAVNCLMRIVAVVHSGRYGWIRTIQKSHKTIQGKTMKPSKKVRLQVLQECLQ